MKVAEFIGKPIGNFAYDIFSWGQNDRNFELGKPLGQSAYELFGNKPVIPENYEVESYKIKTYRK